MLSLPKILLFLAVVVCVVMVTKAFRARAGKVAGKDKGDGKIEILDLNRCAVCGDYAAADVGGCGRADCPIAKGGGGD